MNNSDRSSDHQGRPEERLVIFDTTLRDGEQAPGFKMDCGEKLRLAEALARLGVDVIEAGFPAASEGDFQAVQNIAKRVRGAQICGLARCLPSDIDKTYQALAEAAQPRIHVFLATSPVHREHKLHIDRPEVLRRVVAGVEHARSLCDDVEFSAEDATRTEPEFLVEVVQAAIRAGAKTINIPDTVGYAMPDEIADMIANLQSQITDLDSVTLSIHCHDDLGMATANSLAALRAGARQVECTINGIGERAGNCSLEEVVMAVRTRQSSFGLQTQIDTKALCATSRLLASITGIGVQPNKAIVGINAFAHQAGIHQHGVLQHRETYEIMRPEDVGFTGKQIVLGKHSGRHALLARAKDLGFTLDTEGAEWLFREFKALADKKKEVLDVDLEALLVDHTRDLQGPWKLAAMHCSSGTESKPIASVRLQHENGKVAEEASVGDGPVDATFKAILRAVQLPEASTAHLSDYGVRSLTLGEDAQGQVTVHCTFGEKTLRGRGLSTDIIEASALAFLDVVNQIEHLRNPSQG